jgi:uncharacterized cupin superfamily protein
MWHIGSEMERLVTKLPMRPGEMDLAIWQCCHGDVELAIWECGVGNLNLTIGQYQHW